MLWWPIIYTNNIDLWIVFTLILQFWIWLEFRLELGHKFWFEIDLISGWDCIMLSVFSLTKYVKFFYNMMLHVKMFRLQSTIRIQAYSVKPEV